AKTIPSFPSDSLTTDWTLDWINNQTNQWDVVTTYWLLQKDIASQRLFLYTSGGMSISSWNNGKFLRLSLLNVAVAVHATIVKKRLHIHNSLTR
ncbi:12756_t:CDS:1, partial [Cetraspora pellucida]